VSAAGRDKVPEYLGEQQLKQLFAIHVLAITTILFASTAALARAVIFSIKARFLKA
jgi:hypothetical protein